MIYLNTDQIIRVFPSIIALSCAKYDSYFRTGIQSAWVILKKFGDSIIEAKKYSYSGGVDLNREDKLRKYDTIIEFFNQIKSLDKVKENSQRDMRDLNLIQFLREVDHFIRMVNNI